MFKKILLATDGSSHAEEALKYARDLAVRDNAQVIVVHAFKPLQLPPPYVETSARDEVLRRAVAEGKGIADKAAQQLQDAGVDVDVHVLEGPPAEAILQTADTHQAGLIVMGSRGRSEVTSLLLGSVSHRVLAHSHVPVMIVTAEEDGTGNSRPTRRTAGTEIR